MIKIIDKRGTGKTSRLMLLAKEKNAYIVCLNPKSHISKAEAYGLIGIDFISYEDFLAGKYDIRRKIFIDDIDKMMYYLNERIAGYSCSIDWGIVVIGIIVVGIACYFLGMVIGALNYKRPEDIPWENIEKTIYFCNEDEEGVPSAFQGILVIYDSESFKKDFKINLKVIENEFEIEE